MVIWLISKFAKKVGGGVSFSIVLQVLDIYTGRDGYGRLHADCGEILITFTLFWTKECFK